jgi:deoxycytidylate deaminase
MRLPPKRKPVRSGIERAPRRDWPRHRRFVKSHVCCVCGYEKTDFAHVKTRGSGGGDETGVPLCRACHAEQHTIGIETFQRRHGIDLVALAEEFVQHTPDIAMKMAIAAGR